MAEQEVAEKEQPGAAAPAAAPLPQAASVVAKPSAETPAVEPKKDAEKPAQTPQEKIEFFKARQDKKLKENAMAQELEESKRKLAEYEKRLQEVPQQQPKPDDLDAMLTNPDAWLQQKLDRAFEEHSSAQQKAAAHRASAENATKWLLTRSHLQQDGEFAKEVAKRIEEGYMDVAALNPHAAARAAYLDVCEAKGVSPELPVSDAGRSSAGVRPSAQPMGGNRIFKKGEASAYLYEVANDTSKRDEYLRREAEVAKARSEGRIET